METRHPIQGSFGSEFHCVVVAASSRKTLQFCEKFFTSLEKRPLTLKFSKFGSESFHRLADQRTLLCSNVRFVRREIGEIVRYLLDKKFRLPLKLSLRGSCPRSARTNPQHCTQSAPDFIQIGSPNRRSYSRTREHRQIAPYRVNPIFGGSLASSRIITQVRQWRLTYIHT